MRIEVLNRTEVPNAQGESRRCSPVSVAVEAVAGVRVVRGRTRPTWAQ
jgi:hypothetical protein